MVASLLTGQSDTQTLVALLQPDPLPDGTNPEERMILCGVSWERYLALDKAAGENRSGPHFYYLDGDLEIMTTSTEHERIKKWIADFLADYFLETGLEVVPRGHATIRQALQHAGSEPDESWCLGDEKEVPDLVLEIALTSGGVNKSEIYRRFQVKEVWIRLGDKLEIHARDAAGNYERANRSRLLPSLEIPLLEDCVSIRSWQQARKAFRAGMGFTPPKARSGS